MSVTPNRAGRLQLFRFGREQQRAQRSARRLGSLGFHQLVAKGPKGERRARQLYLLLTLFFRAVEQYLNHAHIKFVDSNNIYALWR